MRNQFGRGCGPRDSGRDFEGGFFGGGRFGAGRGGGRGDGRGGGRGDGRGEGRFGRGFGRGFGHGHGHGRGGGGFGEAMFEKMAAMRGGRVLSSEHLQLVILALVEEKPRHGYEIIKALEEKSHGVYKPSPGMIYPAITYLEEADYVKASTEGSKKQISLTPEGKKHLDENRDHVDRVLERLEAFGERMSNFQDRMAQEQEAEEQWREMREDFSEIRDELRQVFSSKFMATKDERKRVLDILKKALKDIRSGAKESAK